jgi:hypothetical protein
MHDTVLLRSQRTDVASWKSRAAVAGKRQPRSFEFYDPKSAYATLRIDSTVEGRV